MPQLTRSGHTVRLGRRLWQLVAHCDRRDSSADDLQRHIDQRREPIPGGEGIQLLIVVSRQLRDRREKGDSEQPAERATALFTADATPTRSGGLAAKITVTRRG